MLFAAARPIILNGIEEVITRPDLADRAILLMLAPIAERQRRPETALWREFELARPRILGALLDARKAYGALRRCASSGCRAWLISRSGSQPAKRDFDPSTPSKPLIEQPARRDREHRRRRPGGGPCARAHGRPSAMDGSASDLLQVGINVGGNAMAAWTRSGWPESAHSLAGCVGHRPASRAWD